MRPENNPLDLNNLPEDYGRDGKQVADDTSSTGYRKKKSGLKKGKDEIGKVYECRFCSLKFCKSQALGGHMNRHRQERETETLNRARQLVFSNDNLVPQGPSHLGCQQVQPGFYGDPALAFRSIYPSRLISNSSSNILPPPPPPPPSQQPHSYIISYPSQYPPNQMKDCYMGHVLSNQNYMGGASDSGGYTCIGAPVGQGFTPGSDNRDVSLQNQVNWGRQHLDHPSINRFQDGF